MNSDSLNGRNKSGYLPIHRYQKLDPVRDISLMRICQLSAIVCATSKSLILFEESEFAGYKAEFGIDSEGLDFFFKAQSLKDKKMVSCSDVQALSLSVEVSKAFSDNQVKSFVGLPLFGEKGEWLGCFFVLGSDSILLDNKNKTALELLASEILIIIQERHMIAEFTNVEKLFNISKDLICIAGADGYFKKVSPSFTELLGWDEEMLLSRSFFQLIHPNDLSKSRKEIEKLADGVSTIEFSHRFLCQDGSYKTLEWVATPEPTTGNVYSIGRDMTNAKAKEEQLAKSEGRLRVFFENSQGLMCTHDMQGVFLSVNEAGAKRLGYTSAQLVGRSLYDIVPVYRHHLIDQYLLTIKNEGKASGQMITKHLDGSELIWMFNNVLESNAGVGSDYVIGNGLDISKRVQLENELTQARAVLEETGKVARVGGWNFDLKTHKLAWTPMTKIIHGVPDNYEPDVDSSIEFYKIGESRNKIKNALKRAIVNGEHWDLELQIVTSKGNELWIRAIGQAEVEKGKCIRVLGTIQDIDISKRAQLDLEQTRRVLDDVINASSEVCVIATDLDGMITVFNVGAEKMLGYSSEEVVGKLRPTFLHKPEEVQEYVFELENDFGRKIEDSEIFTLRSDRDGFEQRVWTYITKSGDEKIVSLVLTPMRDLEDDPIGYLGIAIDITEKNKIERDLASERSRLNAFVMHAPAAVAMLDKEMVYIAASNQWLKDYNLQGQDIIGKSYYDFFPQIDEVRKSRHQRVLNGAIERKEEDRFRLAGDTEDSFVTWELRPWYLFDGEIGGIMLFTQDITNLVNQREELRKAKQLSEEASIAKSEFLANMSHEIRTPLNGVIGFTDLVLKTNLNETQHQYLSIVNQSGNALLGIINDILDFSKIEAGRLELDIEKCDLYELSAQATDIITYQIQNKGLEMLLNIATDLPRFIYADAIRLKQILVNLLGNASKFTESGEIELKIESLEADGDFHKICFAVRDTGIGIKAEMQSKIFDAFSQEDSSTTKKYGGTGLGLTISNSLLGLMDSRLQLISEPGKGSTFYFEVTLKTELGEAIEWSDVEKIDNVLIVDDNDNNRLIIKQMLLLKNIRSIEASNGFEALQLLSTGKNFDVILMDYHMPFMDGLETIRKIRETFTSWGGEKPIMLLHSSSDDHKIIESCKELRVQHRLIKPIKIQGFYQALSRLYKVNSFKEEQLVLKDSEEVVRNFTVLLAEDNLVNMLLAKTIIKKIAPESIVIETSNGLEALEYCQKQLPDIILMDVQMPVMNGYEATKKIRLSEQGTHVPIIAFTAGNVKGEREKCLEAGMDDFVVKPVVEETIEDILHKWLGSNSNASNKMNTIKSGTNIHYNPAKFQDYTDNDPEVLSQILVIVKSELLNSLNSLKQLIQEENLKPINEAGHKLYGTSISAGMSVLADLAYEFEHTKIFQVTKMNFLIERVEAEIKLVFEMMAEIDSL